MTPPTEPEERWMIGNRNHAATKNRLLDIFGGWCALCGEKDPVVLMFDHKAPIHRNDGRRGSAGSNSLLSNLRKGADNPFNVQVLCGNCHMRKTSIERRR